MDNSPSFDELVDEAWKAGFSGWNFSYLQDRYYENTLSWDYKAIVLENFQETLSLLDMGTGGGEFLFSLKPLPQLTYATEAYLPNVSIAENRLKSIGVKVVKLESDGSLPFDNNFFDLVINRHEAFSPPEISRVLKHGGKFIMQQVGARNNIQLNEAIVGIHSPCSSEGNLEWAVRQIEETGLSILNKKEEFPTTRFYDVGAVVYYLKAVPWQIPDFSIEKHREALQTLHKQIMEDGHFETKAHRYLIEATKSEYVAV